MPDSSPTPVYGSHPIISTPYYQPCSCGQESIRYTDAALGWWYACCVPRYVDEAIIAIGPVRLDHPVRVKASPTAEQIRAALEQNTLPPAGMTSAVYRQFDDAERLLYVGVTDDLNRRFRWHLRHSPWVAFAVRRTISWFPSRGDAENSERAAIQNERPLFNRQHAAAGMHAELAKYLIDRRAVRELENYYEDGPPQT
jgi:predicted GIY-YIG superfamily endonuclease